MLAKLQSRRKQLDLGYTDRIRVVVRGDERVQRVADAWREHITSEALCVDLSVEALEGSEQGDDESRWDSAEAQGSRFAISVERASS